MSNIEWIKNNDGSQGRTWNPTTGCSRKSPGCENCYAETMTKRLAAMGQEKYQGLLNAQGRFNGKVKFSETDLLKPLSVKKPTTWFVNSMSDLFHEKMPDEWIDKVFAVMALCPQHTFQILTKRAERMRDYVSKLKSRYESSIENGEYILGDIACDLTNSPCADYIDDLDFPFPNVWLGVSVENQKTADERIFDLINTPAAVKFLSCEPLLGAINLTNVATTSLFYGKVDVMSGYACGDEPDEMFDWEADPDGWVRKPAGEWDRGQCGVDWVIVGGESGSNARPCDIEWIRSIVRQCDSADVPVFVKQLGRLPIKKPENQEQQKYADYLDARDHNDAPKGFLTLGLSTNNKKGGDIKEFPLDLQIREIPEVKRLVFSGKD